MSLFGCPACQTTPCYCGHEWMHWPLDDLLKHRAMIERVIAQKEKEASVAQHGVERRVPNP